MSTSQPQVADPTGNCPQCQRRLPTDSPHQLCPYCLLSPQAVPTESQVHFRSTGRRSNQSRFDLPTPEDLQPFFGNLRIEGLIGHGGMGAVYLARQESLGRPVALKVLPPEIAASPGFTDRFVREAQALARMSHPNIVHVFEHGTAGPYAYLMMEYVDGANLREMIAGQRLKPAESLRIIGQLCDALQYAHARGVIHRDIKPENILIDAEGQIKITDFGLAKLTSDPITGLATQTQQVMGTVHYMAPEQIERPRDVDHRADLYSLGVVLYELLTGELPLGRFAPPSEKAGTGKHVDRVVMRSLEKEPDRRFESAGQVREGLDSPRSQTWQRVGAAGEYLGHAWTDVGSRLSGSNEWTVEKTRRVFQFVSALFVIGFYLAVFVGVTIALNQRDEEIIFGLLATVVCLWPYSWVASTYLSMFPLPEWAHPWERPVHWYRERPRVWWRRVQRSFESTPGIRAGWLKATWIALVVGFVTLVLTATVDDDDFVLGFLGFPIAFGMARMAIAGSSRVEKGKARWLVMPPILLILAPLCFIGLIWPVFAWYGIHVESPDTFRWLAQSMNSDLVTPVQQMRVSVASCMAMESGWLMLVLAAIATFPDAARWCFRPFLDGWSGQGRFLLLSIVAIFFGLSLLMLCS